MKRKILFVAIITALLACLFAVSAYATEIPEWTEITTVAGMPDKSAFGDDGKAGATSRVLMSDGVPILHTTFAKAPPRSPSATPILTARVVSHMPQRTL